MKKNDGAAVRPFDGEMSHTRRLAVCALSLTLTTFVACSTVAEHADRPPASGPNGKAAIPVDIGPKTQVATSSAGAPTTMSAAMMSGPGHAGNHVATSSGGQVEPLTAPVVRALYVNRWTAQSRKRVQHLIAIADSTEINALVIDMKDEFGLNYNSAHPEFARNAGTANKIHDVKALLDTLEAHHILPIARMVVFKDSVTARLHPEWTIRRADNTVWRDKKGIAWVNPYHRELWEYNIGVAEELVKLGFREIQFDYIRFPEPYPSLPKQVFPGADGTSKTEALAQYLEEAKTRLNKLGVRSTADIFGLVTTVQGPLEVGQEWEKISPHVDVVLPMVYPSHYPHGSFGIPAPNADPYRVITIALSKAHERDMKLGITSARHVRPWLQAFTLGRPEYGPAQLRAEKKAAYDSGYDGWVMWNPGSWYDIYLPALERKTTIAASR